MVLRLFSYFWKTGFAQVGNLYVPSGSFFYQANFLHSDKFQDFGLEKRNPPSRFRWKVGNRGREASLINFHMKLDSFDFKKISKLPEIPLIYSIID